MVCESLGSLVREAFGTPTGSVSMESIRKGIQYDSYFWLRVDS